MTHSSVALLVDGDNVPAHFAGQILRKTQDLGPPRLRLAFCNSQSLSDWSSAPSFRLIHTGPGKNGADILLSITAMELALKEGVKAFAIASSDSDLSHVATRLRELDRHVLGLGEAKAPASFRHACHRFLTLEHTRAEAGSDGADPIALAMRAIFAKHGPDGDGVALNRLNALVRTRNSTIKISETAYRTWPRYLAAHPDLYALVGDGPDRRVRPVTGRKTT